MRGSICSMLLERPRTRMCLRLEGSLERLPAGAAYCHNAHRPARTHTRLLLRSSPPSYCYFWRAAPPPKPPPAGKRYAFTCRNREGGKRRKTVRAACLRLSVDLDIDRHSIMCLVPAAYHASDGKRKGRKGRKITLPVCLPSCHHLPLSLPFISACLCVAPSSSHNSSQACRILSLPAACCVSLYLFLALPPHCSLHHTTTSHLVGS